MTKIAIIHYSMYGHIATMSEAVKRGVLAFGSSVECDIFRVEETLPPDILEKMHAPPKGDYPIISKDQLPEYDGFLFGISGRYGMISAQMKVKSVMYIIWG
jgi:NAD(P)H dehydrogenase (quinone)